LLDASERAKSGMASFLRVHSLRDVFVNLILQMKLQLLAEIQLRLVFAEKRA
jgi:hypothetical protein